MRRAAEELGLSVIEPVRYGVQDLIILTKVPATPDKVELMTGWHGLENHSSRWTERIFEVRMTPSQPGPLTLRFRFYLPEILFQAGQPVRLSATAAGLQLATSEYSGPGEYVYAADFRATSTDARISIRFELDTWYGPSSIDERELGLLVGFASATGPLSRRLQPFQLNPARTGEVAKKSSGAAG